MIPLLHFVEPVKVVYDMMTELQADTHLACYSETDNPTIFQYALAQVKDKLLEDPSSSIC